MKAIVITYAGNEPQQHVLTQIVKALTDYDIVNTKNIDTLEVAVLTEQDIAKIIAKNCVKTATNAQPKTPWEFVSLRYPVLSTSMSFEGVLRVCDTIKHDVNEASKVDDNRLKNAIQYVVTQGKSAAISRGLTESGYFALKIANPNG